MTKERTINENSLGGGAADDGLGNSGDAADEFANSGGAEVGFGAAEFE